MEKGKHSQITGIYLPVLYLFSRVRPTYLCQKLYIDQEDIFLYINCLLTDSNIIIPDLQQQMKKQIKTSNSKNQMPQTSIEQSTGYSPKGLKKQNKFLETNSLSQKQKLIQQNIRLKTQIFELSQQLHQIMGEENKNKNTIKQGLEDEVIKAKVMQLKRQQLEVLNLRNKINIVKRQLESVFSNRVLLVKEDQMKKLRNQLETLQDEKKNLIKLKDNQTKVLKIIKTEEAYQERIDQLKKQYQELKEQAKSLHQTQIESQRALRKNHQNFIVKQTKLKQIQQKIDEFKANNKANKAKNPQQQVTHQMINELKQELANLEKERKKNEKQWQDKINRVDAEISQKKAQQERKLAILKYKQRQLRLIELKIKQVGKEKNRKSMSQSVRAAPVDVDMHQFRHKRNIKYMRE